MFAEWLARLEAWQVAETLRTSIYIYPLVNAAHIFGIALIVGAILPTDLRLLGLFRRIPLVGFLSVMTGFAACGVVIAAVSGFLLFTVQPRDYVANPAFLTKIVLVGAAILNALILRLAHAWRVAATGQEPDAFVRISALLSLILWPAALVAGRWIGYL